MRDTETLTLAHPRVQALKRKWEAALVRYSPKHTLSFEDLFEYFKANCHRMEVIGAHGGITRQRVQQIYNKWFRDLFGDLSGRDRQKSCTLEKNLARLEKETNELLSNGKIKTIGGKLRSAGCVITGIAGSGGRLLRNQITLNGHRCLVHTSTKARSLGVQTERLYYAFNVSLSLLQTVEAVIFYVCAKNFQERLFVVPSSVLLAAFFETSADKKYNRVYIPAEKILLRTRGVVSRINWWQYEDALHLLAPKDLPAP
ncbi:MAG: hypothetical protein AAB449_03290 [Patescibacteria group bacterium]